jgi:hypothetical protein
MDLNNHAVSNRREKNMVADRAYSTGLLASSDRRTSLFYFAAAVPTVGFVHGTADLSPLNAAALEGYAEDRFINRAPRIDTASRRWSSAG